MVGLSRMIRVRLTCNHKCPYTMAIEGILKRSEKKSPRDHGSRGEKVIPYVAMSRNKETIRKLKKANK